MRVGAPVEHGGTVAKCPILHNDSRIKWGPALAGARVTQTPTASRHQLSHNKLEV